ncbi:MAG: TetR/AcrR family transcriptional regulator [Sandaracinaceae bacterium]
MDDAPRARFSVDERRTQLLELGLRLFGDRAYDDVSIDDIAKEAGVSKGLLYHYFGGKRAFYVACVGHAASALLEALDSVEESDLPESERPRAGLEAYLDFVQARAAPYIALARGGIGNDPEVSATLEAARSEIVRRLVEGLGLEEPRPMFRLAARSWIGQVEASCLDWLEHDDVPRESLVRLLLSGLYVALMTAIQLDPDADVQIGAPPSFP